MMRSSDCLVPCLGSDISPITIAAAMTTSLRDATVHEIQLEPIRRAAIVREVDRGGEVQTHRDLEETDRTLGLGRQQYGLLSIWWD